MCGCRGLKSALFARFDQTIRDGFATFRTCPVTKAMGRRRIGSYVATVGNGFVAQNCQAHVRGEGEYCFRPGNGAPRVAGTGNSPLSSGKQGSTSRVYSGLLLSERERYALKSGKSSLKGQCAFLFDAVFSLFFDHFLLCLTEMGPYSEPAQLGGDICRSRGRPRGTSVWMDVEGV